MQSVVPGAGGNIRGRERCSQCHLAGWLGQGWQVQGALDCKAGYGQWWVMAGLGKKCRLALGTLGTQGQREKEWRCPGPTQTVAAPRDGPGIWA